MSTPYLVLKFIQRSINHRLVYTTEKVDRCKGKKYCPLILCYDDAFLDALRTTSLKAGRPWLKMKQENELHILENIFLLFFF